MKTRDEDTTFGRKTYFGERVLLHPDIHADSTSITLVRNEEMRYGSELTRGDWSVFFSAREIQTIAEFVERHRIWLEWGCSHNALDLQASPDGYTAQPGSRDEDLSTYQLYSSICCFYPELPSDPTGIVLVCNDANQYGVCTVGNLIFPPTFYGAADILKIATFVANNHLWLEWGRACNEIQTINATKANVYISLQYQASTDLDSEVSVPDGTRITILLFTSDSYAYYGIPGAEQELSGPCRWRPYPRKHWQSKAPGPATQEQ